MGGRVDGSEATVDPPSFFTNLPPSRGVYLGTMDEKRRREFRDNETLNADERRALFEELWRAWRPRLAVYLRSFTRLSAEDAEELAGDALLRAMEKASSYDPARPFAPWIYSLTRRLALSALRRAGRKAELAVEPTEFDAREDERRPGPEALCLDAERRAEAARLLSALPAPERELAYLVYGAGLSLAEAAAATKSPLGTVKWRLHRMRVRLRAAKEAIDARP